jgi:hypothetical protein
MPIPGRRKRQQRPWAFLMKGGVRQQQAILDFHRPIPEKPEITTATGRLARPGCRKMIQS